MLWAALQEACLAFGFDSFLFSCHKPSKRDFIVDPMLAAALPDAFGARYDSLGLAERDPIFAQLAQAEGPLYWRIPPRRAGEDGCDYFDFIRSTPLRCGVWVPLAQRPGTISAFSAISFHERAHGPDVTYALMITADAAAMKAELLGLTGANPASEAAESAGLSPCQAAILGWIAEGKSNRDVASIMNLSERAVRFHVSEILRKLGVASRSQAAAMFRARGFQARPSRS